LTITTGDIATYYKELCTVIKQMGSDVVLRTPVNNQWKDYTIRAYGYNVSTTSAKSQSEFFIQAGSTFETGYVHIFPYNLLNFIPKPNSVIIIPKYTNSGPIYPIKVQDVFTIKEIDPLTINNIVLFLIVNSSRSELNTWKRPVV